MKRRLHDGDTLSAVEGDFEDSPHRDRGPDTDRARIGYADFVAICHVVNPKDFGGFRVEANGLYVNLPPADATLTPEERAAVTWHPTGQYDKPALPLPCTLGQLRAFLPDAGMAGSIDEESVAALLGGREYMAGWYNETLDAEMWFGLASPTPHEAAMLLCQHNPHENACDPMKTTTDETGPEDFKRLLRVFEDLEKVEPKARPLRQWLAIARDKGLKYHSWIDAYVMAQVEELPADAGGVAKVGAGTTAAIEEPETKNWILLIQAEAARRWKLLRDAGATPTKNNIKDDLAKWCRESSVATDGGINPTAEYIYRHVLQKWTPPTG